MSVLVEKVVTGRRPLFMKHAPVERRLLPAEEGTVYDPASQLTSPDPTLGPRTSCHRLTARTGKNEADTVMDD